VIVVVRDEVVEKAKCPSNSSRFLTQSSTDYRSYLQTWLNNEKQE